MKLAILKGTRDYYPEEQCRRERILTIIKKYFHSYGYQPLETPILNYFEVLASKYAGGAEILKETYSMTDQGGRDIGLRYDLTVPFSRFIGMNRNLNFPFKRYEIGKVFRNGPVKSGRAREFTQCDVDVCGTSSMLADAELIAMSYSIFRELNLPATVEINNRKILSGLILSIVPNEEIVSHIILSLDKLKKIGADGVLKEFEEKNIPLDQGRKILDIIDMEGDFSEKINRLERSGCQNERFNEGIEEIKKFYDYCMAADIPKEVINFNPSLARGLEIYTGTVFEIFAIDSPITSSLAAGGRYDKIIGSFLGVKEVESYPAVGICFGLDVIYAVLENMDEQLGPDYPYLAHLIPMGTEAETFKLLTRIRNRGFSAGIEMKQKKLKKSLNFANKNNIPLVVIIGEDELKEKKYTVKVMNESKELKLDFEGMINLFQEYVS